MHLCCGHDQGTLGGPLHIWHIGHVLGASAVSSMHVASVHLPCHNRCKMDPFACVFCQGELKKSFYIYIYDGFSIDFSFLYIVSDATKESKYPQYRYNKNQLRYSLQEKSHFVDEIAKLYCTFEKCHILRMSYDTMILIRYSCQLGIHHASYIIHVF